MHVNVLYWGILYAGDAPLVFDKGWLTCFRRECKTEMHLVAVLPVTAESEVRMKSSEEVCDIHMAEMHYRPPGRANHNFYFPLTPHCETNKQILNACQSVIKMCSNDQMSQKMTNTYDKIGRSAGFPQESDVTCCKWWLESFQTFRRSLRCLRSANSSAWVQCIDAFSVWWCYVLCENASKSESCCIFGVCEETKAWRQPVRHSRYSGVLVCSLEWELQENKWRGLDCNIDDRGKTRRGSILVSLAHWNKSKENRKTGTMPLYSGWTDHSVGA